MSMIQAQQMILAIGSRGDFLRTYQDDKELIANVGPGELSGPIEFFNSDGHRLAGVYDDKWHLLALTPTSGQPDFPALLQQVRHIVDHVLQSFTKDNPEESKEFEAEIKEILLQLPRLRTSADLREFLQNFLARRSIVSPLRAPNDEPEQGAWKRIVGH
ncbi:MAG: hypothetical protein ACRDTC_01760 [Pseudonocardiaceae bacterium]